ncbi:hypothetical protein Ait01nite_089730 [Actinoplanes italicus]|uniref:Uncharacterized protein n=1 Tax=Actinoplanes italicus TaxID=113567 RepID=A0A2T0JII0_9ACTN|nr:hypothetical protein [Actinoplanes italicus]PRX07390.1 hypothetical protein CLV67_14265 [Actinoplanes italicus]GIE35928.1 hypothetical protein Ait01nite_089730 [Actinoplanes italicus]
MIGLGDVDGVDTDMNIRAAALELAVDAYDPDQVMISVPGARVMPAAEEIVETAKAFEAYLRGTDQAEDEPAEPKAEEPPPCNCSMCAQRRKAETFQRIAAAARRLGKPADPPTDSVNPLGTLAGLILGGETVDDHLSRCSDCRTLVKAAGGLVPPWLGGRSGG